MNALAQAAAHLVSNLRGRTAYARMLAQAQVWDETTRFALEKAGLDAGQRALDVGCGPGAALRLLADRVGPDGEVIGIDRDAAMVHATRVALSDEGLTPVVRLMTADFTTDDTLADGSFDLVLARVSLLHLPDPISALQRAWRWVRPGGSLVVMDYDCASVRATPPQAQLDRACQLINRALRRAGCDVEEGTRVPALFAQAGIGVDGCAVRGVIRRADSTVAMVRAALDSQRAFITQQGLADALSLDELDQALDTCAPLPVFGRWPDMIATWKRKRAVPIARG